MANNQPMRRRSFIDDADDDDDDDGYANAYQCRYWLLVVTGLINLCAHIDIIIDPQLTSWLNVYCSQAAYQLKSGVWHNDF